MSKAETTRSKLRNLSNDILYAGVSKQDLYLLREEINLKNYQMIQYVSVIVSIYFAILCLVFELQVMTDVTPYRILYRAALSWALFFTAFCQIFQEFVLRFATVAWYFMIVGIYTYAILLGTMVQTTAPATAFCALLIAMPFLAIDRPFRIIILQFLSCAIFVILSYLNKPMDIVTSDFINSVMFFLLSSTLTIYASNLKVVNLLNLRNNKIKMATDEMTGLLNKKAIERTVQTYLFQRRGNGALLIIDLDNFKQINDTRGHEFGDRVLCKVADNIQHAFRSSDYKARFGGDEFIVFMTQIEDAESVASRLDYFRERMAHSEISSETGTEMLEIPQSIGVALYSNDHTEYEELFKKADDALYESKRNGKNRYTFADSE